MRCELKVGASHWEHDPQHDYCDHSTITEWASCTLSTLRELEGEGVVRDTDWYEHNYISCTQYRGDDPDGREIWDWVVCAAFLEEGD